ncbi:MAG: cytochrome c oxidase accessory protein CcoG [Flavobacteriales bacterium]|nr:cytochrome c oxidase accessory protein CcoG [Flavobacteriales bacterium]
MNNDLVSDNESFRDAISTVDESGKRIWIYPKKPTGKFYDYRKWVSYFLLALLFLGPYIKIGGNPMFMFNVIERKFSILGQIFWPQDLHIFAMGMIVIILFITLFTVVFGRLFCGWVCPQTIFMEMVFRRIEYWIEGDWKQQQRLNKAPWNGEKIVKKVSKQAIFWVISFLIANTFLAYIIGYEELFKIIGDNPMDHLGGLFAIVIFTTIFYLVFSMFREQVCTVVCPYGRLQSVLLDNKSLVVAYDYKRGEGRAKFRKGENRADAGKGDCIDCNQCVNVCPTGIDIRNGTQLECVNCTACMDACDYMMENVGLEKGLIRIESIDGIENNTKFKITTRVAAYIGVLTLLVGLLTAVLLTRSDFEATILRSRGTLFQKMENGAYSNIYDINLVNKTNLELPVEIRLLKGNGDIQLVGDDIVLKSQDEAKGKFLIIIDKENIDKRKLDLVVGVYSDDKLIEKVKTTFIGPI